MSEKEFDNIVSKKDKVQHINFNQLRLEVHDTYRKTEKIITYFIAVNDEDVIKKAYIDEKLSKIEGHLSLLEKDYNDFTILSSKQSVEEVLIHRAVKATVQVP